MTMNESQSIDEDRKTPKYQIVAQHRMMRNQYKG